MPTFEYDRRYVERGLEILEDYLLADDGYWPIGTPAPAGEPAYPMLTLEGLKLSLLRLSVYRGRLTFEHQIEKLAFELDILQKRWAVAWEKKAQRAYHARLAMWGNYLEEYSSLPDVHADRYVYEVRLRVFLAILTQDVGALDTGMHPALPPLDDFLKATLLPGKFIWDEELQVVFPADSYWYLYGRLPIIIPSQSYGSDPISSAGYP
jgi:hypothetical protein